MMWNKLFKTTFAFTYDDILKSYGENGLPLSVESNTQFKGILTSLELSLGYTFKDSLDEETTSFVIDLYNRLYLRYMEHYSIIADELKDELIKKFMIKLFNVLDYTYPKYSLLLKLYKEQEGNMLKALETSDSESHSTTQNESHNNGTTDEGITKINDTPQTEDVEAEFEDDQYVSELHKNKNVRSDIGNTGIIGSASITRTHSSDPATLIERLNEIKGKYALTMKNWLNEFDGLFIEEGNIDL